MNESNKINLVIQQGATFRHRFAWRDKKGRPIDITGFTARMQARSSVSDSESLLTLTSENGGISIGGKNGIISLYASDSATAQIQWPRGLYDLELIATNGDVFRIAEGKITVSFEVTKI